MRHIVWLAGCLLLLSCSVNNDNLNTDAGGTGGVTGSGGVTGTGGVTSSGGVTGSGGVSGSGGVGGCPRCVGTGGASATGGQVGTGGQTATGGKTGTGGSATGGHGAGGSGGAGGKSCDALEVDYNTALTAAMKCTLGATGQCQQLVNKSLSCPGCKQYVNDTTALSAIQTAWDDQNCNSGGHVCPAIACVIPTTNVCTSSPASGGPSVGADAAGTCAPALTPAN